MEDKNNTLSSKRELSAVFSCLILGVVSCFLWYKSSDIVEIVLNWIFTKKPESLELFIVLPITLIFAFVVIVIAYFGIGIGIDYLFKKSKSSQNIYYIVLGLFLIFTVFIYLYFIYSYLMVGENSDISKILVLFFMRSN